MDCAFTGYTIDTLNRIPTTEDCQGACIIDPECTYFVYIPETKNCELRSSGERVCHFVRGTAAKNFISCVDSGYITWPWLSELDV